MSVVFSKKKGSGIWCFAFDSARTHKKSFKKHPIFLKCSQLCSTPNFIQRSGIWGFAFNADSTRMATISKDKTWRLYNIDVEFDRGADPVLVSWGAHPFDPETSSDIHVALSPDAKTLAASCNTDVAVIDVTDSTTAAVSVLSGVHGEEPVSGQALFLCATFA